MNLVMKMASRYVPTFLKKRELRKLLTVTAKAFGCEPPTLTQLSFDESLRAFAAFTERQTQLGIERGEDLERIGRLLRDATYETGKRYARLFGVTDTMDAMLAARIIYRIIGINFLGTPRGEVTINHCFFSNYYSAPTCRVVSALDEGLLAGLSGGGTLSFSQRITEGYDLCRATLIPIGTPGEKSNHRWVGSGRGDRR